MKSYESIMRRYLLEIETFEIGSIVTDLMDPCEPVEVVGNPVWDSSTRSIRVPSRPLVGDEVYYPCIWNLVPELEEE